MARLSIKTTGPKRPVAPAGLWFEAADISGFAAAERRGSGFDPSFHDITYVWRLRGDPLPPFSAPQNLLPVWNNPNWAYGKQVVFFFPRPGRYVVEVTARDAAGTSVRAAREITIADPDRVYAGAQTLCVSDATGETWSDAPRGSVRLRDLDALQTALEAGKDPVRVLLKRGQSWQVSPLALPPGRLAHLGTWGTGQRPILQQGQQTFLRFPKNETLPSITITGLDFRGGWEAATERGIDSKSPLSWSQPRRAGHYSVWDCRFDGFEQISPQVGKDLASTVLFGDCTITNWRNYGILMRSGAARLGLVGVSIAQHPDALHGERKAGGLANNHGPLRIPDCASLYIGASDFFSRTGWSGLAGEKADQPCLRLNTNGFANRRFVLDRISCEGGLQTINLAGSNAKVKEHPGNYLIDKALLIGTAKTIGPFVAVDFAGLTLRNAIGILPDAPRRHPNRWQGALRTAMENPAPGNAEGHLSVYSSTFVNLLSPAHRDGKPWPLYSADRPFGDLTLENNILLGPGDAGAADLRAALPGIRPRFRGIRYGFALQSSRLERAVPPGQGFEIAYREIKDQRADQQSGRPTSQAYWQQTEKRDQWHMLVVQGVRGTLYAQRGDFKVRFGRRSVEIVNTGDTAWDRGSRWTLKLDRTSRLPGMETRYANPSRLPLPRPRPGMDAYQGAGMGRVARDDFLMRPRGALPSQGATEPE